MRTRHLLIALAVVAAASPACKKDETVAPGPTDTSAATSTAAPPADAAPVDTGAVAPPPQPGPGPVTGPKDAGATDAGATDAGAKDAGGTADAGKADAGATTNTGCISKCQGVLQACLTPTPGKDGGLPKIGDPVACKAAADACQAACK